MKVFGYISLTLSVIVLIIASFIMMMGIGCGKKEPFSAKACFKSEKDIIIELKTEGQGKIEYCDETLWALWIKNGDEIIEVVKPTVDKDKFGLWQSFYDKGNTIYKFEFNPTKVGTEYWIIKATQDYVVRIY